MSFGRWNAVALCVAGFGLIAAPSTTWGQEWPRHELPPLIEEEREVAIALSAAPDHVSQNASVLVLKRGGFVRVREGSNGFICLVERYWAQAVEPMCLNEEASATILPVLLRRSELRESGASLEEIDQAIEAGYERGEFRLPEKLAVAYMLSAAQDLYGDDGRHHGQWVPHFMIYIPYLTATEIGGRGGGGLVVFRAGKRDAALIIVAREFMEPNLRG